LLLALAPPALDKLELDSILPMLPNSLMDVAEVRLLLLVPLPELLIGDETPLFVSAAAVVGGDGDRHFMLLLCNIK